MQAESNAKEPRKLNIPGSEGLSVAELETVPLKKRLEILFTSNIIPSRRQLAVKFGLDERLIHNVLSHRTYILQNWKYNSDAEHLLSKLELENAMAFMELLIEWKRRVELNGLQMTHAALLRKTLALQKILKPNTLKLCDDWWQLFNENWEHKHFHDSEADSLEFEDILNDLQWMFTESTFNRLMIRLRRARSGGRTRVKRETTKDDSDSTYIDDEDDTNDISEIKAEPLYYNDDGFDCEDYEFVLDEELVLESLRRELADAEAAKYQRYMGIDNAEFLHSAEEEKSKETEEFIEEFVITKSESFEENNEEIESKAGIVSEELQENSNFLTNTSISTDSIDPFWSMTDQKVPVPIRLEIVNPVTTPLMDETPKPVPKPFRRKPRNLHAKLTVRKDCVRLPATAEIANSAMKRFEIQEIRKDAIEVEKNDELLQQHTRKRKNQSKASTEKEVVLSRSPSPSPEVTSVFEEVDHASNEGITDTVNRINMTTPPILPSNETIVESTMPIKSNLQEFPSLLKTESNSAPCGLENEIVDTATTQLTNDKSNKKKKRSNLKTDLKNSEFHDDEGELILGICPSSVEGSQLESSTSQQLASERRKQKFKHKLKNTSVQILEPTVSKDDKDADARNSQLQLQQSIQKNLKPEKKSRKNQGSTKNAVKRSKRRTDDSDLTLRRDKVRLSLATVKIIQKTGGEDSQRITDVCL